MRSTIRPLIFASLLMYTGLPAFADQVNTTEADLITQATELTHSSPEIPTMVIPVPSFMNGKCHPMMGKDGHFYSPDLPVVPEELSHIPPGSLPSFDPATLMSMPPAPFYIVDIPLPEPEVDMEQVNALNAQLDELKAQCAQTSASDKERIAELEKQLADLDTLANKLADRLSAQTKGLEDKLNNLNGGMAQQFAQIKPADNAELISELGIAFLAKTKV